MSTGAQAYARTVQASAPAREVEAQALLKAAKQLQDLQSNWSHMDPQRIDAALRFNRQLWAIFLSAAQNEENPQPIDVRQKIANIGVFVMNQTVDMQLAPEPAKLNSLIEINRNIAAGLSGRA
jgi:flagellar biosynthesis activator protein FlaF